MAFLDLSGLQRFKTKLESLFVKGPASATANQVATFDGTTGKAIKDSGYTIATSVPSGAVFTDTKVTSSANHYTPATVSGSDKTASASGATAAWSIDVVKGVTLNTDGKGHVTGISVTSGKIPANPNTDTKVRQTLVTNDNVNRPLLLAYSNNSTTTTNVDNVSYRANTIYANQSTGTVTATNFVGKINNHIVNKDVPSDAIFMSAADKTKLDGVATSSDIVVSNIAGVKSTLVSFANNMSVGESKLVRITHTDDSYSEIMEPNVKYSGYLTKNDSDNFSWLASGYLVMEPVIFSYFSTAQYWVSEKLAINSNFENFIDPGPTAKNLDNLAANESSIIYSDTVGKPSFIDYGICKPFYASTYQAQIAMSIVSDKIGIRHKLEGTWQPWQELALNDNTVSFRSAPFDGYTNQQICDALASEYGEYFSVVFTVKNPPTGAIDSGCYLAVRNRYLSTSINVTKIGTWLGNPS